jgi:HD-GYP domain-containing protein (c-di-GMP phosphodiesterase class II)
MLQYGGLPVAAVALLALVRPAALSGVDNAVYDTMLRWSTPARPDPRVVIIDIDERSLSTIGQWPWRRDVIGGLIAQLRDLGAATIALDIIFAEPDRYQALLAADHTFSAHVTQGTPDQLLADSVRAGNVVLGNAMTFAPDAMATGRCVLHPLNLTIVHPPDSWSSPAEEKDAPAPFFQATGSICNLKALAEAAGQSGFLNAAPDSDGVLRRAPLLIELNGHVYPSLALAAVSAGLGTHDAALRVDTVNAAALTIERRKVPLDGKSNLLLRYRGPKSTFPYVSAVDVMGGRVPRETIREKIVFVGTTALGTREVVATPLDTLFVGVEVQATIADNLLQQDFIYRPVSGSVLESLAVVSLGVVVTLLVAWTSLMPATVAGLASLAVTWGGAVWLLSANGVFLSPLYPSAAVALTFAFMTAAKFTVEHRRAETAMLTVETTAQRAEAAGQEKSRAQQLMIQTLLSLTESRDTETGKHSRRTSRYAKVLAEALAKNPAYSAGLTPERIELLSSLAPLHDIGKVGVPDAVLNKAGVLAPDELAEMRRHPVYGLEVIVRAEKYAGITDDAILAMAKEIVYTHHEKWDGSGYPRSLKGAAIPVPGRVVALVDVYDACTTARPYRPQPMSQDQVIQLIIAGRGTHFDPAIVDAFLTVVPLLPVVTEEEDFPENPPN